MPRLSASERAAFEAEYAVLEGKRYIDLEPWERQRRVNLRLQLQNDNKPEKKARKPKVGLGKTEFALLKQLRDALAEEGMLDAEGIALLKKLDPRV